MQKLCHTCAEKKSEKSQNMLICNTPKIVDIIHSQQELSHDSIARLNCALPITKTISVIRQTTFKFVHLKINIDLGV